MKVVQNDEDNSSKLIIALAVETDVVLISLDLST